MVRGDGRSRYVVTAAVLAGAFLFCAAAIVYFYGLRFHGEIFPFKSRTALGFAVLRTALIAMLGSSWAAWWGTRRKSSLAMTLLRVGFSMQISLTLFAILGSGIVLGSSKWSRLEFVFPSIFFAEYQWLTFIFEVAPTTSIAAGLLSFFSLRDLDS